MSIETRKIFVGKNDVRGLMIEPQDPTDNGGFPICYVIGRENELYARRLCAAWNYCEGVPTDELESKGAESGFWGRACARLLGEKEKLQAENGALRAAVKEMRRVFPIIEAFESNYPDIWVDLASGTGIATLNAYRQTLETALAKMNESEAQK